MPPFQNEGPERQRTLPPAALQRHVQPFGEEGEERDVKRSKPVKNHTSKLKPFCDETFEDSESEPEFSGNAESSTFALGWDTLASFNKATAWSKHAAQERSQTVVKRSYNNKKRAAAAAENPNGRKSGVFAKQGADYGRVEQLLQQDYKCASFMTKLVNFCFLLTDGFVVMMLIDLLLSAS